MDGHYYLMDADGYLLHILFANFFAGDMQMAFCPALL